MEIKCLCESNYAEPYYVQGSNYWIDKRARLETVLVSEYLSGSSTYSNLLPIKYCPICSKEITW